MSRALITIKTDADREKAAAWAIKAPDGTRIEYKATRRSLPQNAKLWAALTDVAQQVKWHGQKLKAEDWKFVFLDALKEAERTVPNIDGTGFVSLRRSSDLSKEEMGNLIDLIHMFGAQHGVKFSDEQESAA